jgi:hypothetical protein
MKFITTLLILLSTLSFAQTKTSNQDGNFYNPLIWTPIGIPASGDTLIINHDIGMTAGIPYAAGQIQINSGGSLTDGGVDQDIYINGGSLINAGILDCDAIWLDSGYVTNSGSMNLDSLWTQDEMTNSGSITVYDFLNDQDADFSTSIVLTVTNNFNNQGQFQNSGEMIVENDFSNCNIQSMDAIFSNSGTVCVTNDFSNCGGDTLTGTGNYHIGGSSSNLGVFSGPFTFNTPSGTVGIPGTQVGGVTISNTPCGLSVVENNNEIYIYPNPATDYLIVNSSIVAFEIYDYSGRLIESNKVTNGAINVHNLSVGMYVIKLTSLAGDLHSTSFVKQ